MNNTLDDICRMCIDVLLERQRRKTILDSFTVFGQLFEVLGYVQFQIGFPSKQVSDVSTNSVVYLKLNVRSALILATQTKNVLNQRRSKLCLLLDRDISGL